MTSCLVPLSKFPHHTNVRTLKLDDTSSQRIFNGTRSQNQDSITLTTRPTIMTNHLLELHKFVYSGAFRDKSHTLKYESKDKNEIRAGISLFVMPSCEDLKPSKSPPTISQKSIY
ncbi:hypothetical protein TNCV_3235541 [Trichonephila clavipes]|nr:hypothetical protein TNCV_3235541 [Trichonephila clavipes]